jgi:hypothetical protein
MYYLEKEIKIRIGDKYAVAKLLVTDDSISFDYDQIQLETRKELPFFHFFKLRELREELEKLDIFLILNGNRVDVWGRSFKTYVYELGKTSPPTIEIFEEPENLQSIGTVQAQKEFHDKWIKSIKELPPPYLTDGINWDEHPDKANFYYHFRDGKTIFLIKNGAPRGTLFTLIDGYNVVDLKGLPENWILRVIE